MHFSDGSTLTDDDVYPHQLSEEQQSRLTSVERIVKGWHLTIMKSPYVCNFFISTTAYQNMTLKPGRQGPAPEVALRALGCYIKDSDPPLRLTLSMAPKSKNVSFIVEAVDSFRPDGFSRALKPLGKLHNMVQKDMGEGISWGVLNRPPVKRVYPTKDGLGGLIEVTNTVDGIVRARRVMAELKMNGKTCQLLVSPG